MSTRRCSKEYQFLGETWVVVGFGDWGWYLTGRVGRPFDKWGDLGIKHPRKFLKSIGVQLLQGKRGDGTFPWMSESDVCKVASYLKALDSARLSGLLEGVE